MNTHPTRRQPIPLPSQCFEERVYSDGMSDKVYTDGRKFRSDSTENGITTINIWRPDLEMGYRIDWNNRTYTAIPMSIEEMEETTSVDIEDDLEWEYVDSEELNARKVDVYDVFRKGESYRCARIFVDTETHIRWKKVTFNSLGKEVLTIETKNAEIGPPPDSVFELPEGLQEFKIPKFD